MRSADSRYASRGLRNAVRGSGASVGDKAITTTGRRRTHQRRNGTQIGRSTVRWTRFRTPSGERHKEGMLGHEGLLGLQICDDFCMPRHNATARCNLHSGIAADVPNPIGPSVIGGNDQQGITETLARQEDLAGQAGFATSRSQENPTWRPFEIPPKQTNQSALGVSDKQAWNEVQACGKRFTHARCSLGESCHTERLGDERPALRSSADLGIGRDVGCGWCGTQAPHAPLATNVPVRPISWAVLSS